MLFPRPGEKKDESLHKNVKRQCRSWQNSTGTVRTCLSDESLYKIPTGSHLYLTKLNTGTLQIVLKYNRSNRYSAVQIHRHRTYSFGTAALYRYILYHRKICTGTVPVPYSVYNYTWYPVPCVHCTVLKCHWTDFTVCIVSNVCEQWLSEPTTIPKCGSRFG